MTDRIEPIQSGMNLHSFVSRRLPGEPAEVVIANPHVCHAGREHPPEVFSGFAELPILGWSLRWQFVRLEKQLTKVYSSPTGMREVLLGQTTKLKLCVQGSSQCDKASLC